MFKDFYVGRWTLPMWTTVTPVLLLLGAMSIIEASKESILNISTSYAFAILLIMLAVSIAIILLMHKMTGTDYCNDGDREGAYWVIRIYLVLAVISFVLGLNGINIFQTAL